MNVKLDFLFINHQKGINKYITIWLSVGYMINIWRLNDCQGFDIHCVALRVKLYKK